MNFSNTLSYNILLNLLALLLYRAVLRVNILIINRLLFLLTSYPLSQGYVNNDRVILCKFIFVYVLLPLSLLTTSTNNSFLKVSFFSGFEVFLDEFELAIFFSGTCVISFFIIGNVNVHES